MSLVMSCDLISDVPTKQAVCLCLDVLIPLFNRTLVCRFLALTNER